MSSIACLFVFLRLHAPLGFKLPWCPWIVCTRFVFAASALPLVVFSVGLFPKARCFFVTPDSAIGTSDVCFGHVSNAHVFRSQGSRILTFCKSSVFVNCHRHGFKWLRQLSIDMQRREPCLWRWGLRSQTKGRQDANVERMELREEMQTEEGQKKGDRQPLSKPQGQA